MIFLRNESKENKLVCILFSGSCISCKEGFLHKLMNKFCFSRFENMNTISNEVHRASL